MCEEYVSEKYPSQWCKKGYSIKRNFRSEVNILVGCENVIMF